MEESTLDGSLNSLREVDRAIRNINAADRHALLENAFSMLVAYSGKVIINRKKGRWSMVKSDLGNIWEPYIVSSDGFVYSTYDKLWDALYEWEGGFSLYHVVDIALAWPLGKQ